MISSYGILSGLIVQSLPLLAANEPAASSVAPILEMADQALSVAAVLILAGLCARRLANPVWDPLATAADRPNHIREEAVLLALLAWLVAATILSGVVRSVTGAEQSTIGSIVISQGANLVGSAACVFIAITRFDGGFRRFLLGSRPKLLDNSVGLGVMLLALGLGICPIVRDLSIAAILLVDPGFEFGTHPTIEALQSQEQSIGMLIALWGGAVVVAPIAEELFFRGVVQTFLSNVIPGRWPAILLGAILFGAIHFTQLHAVGALAVLGVILGYSYERTGSLLLPMLIHAAFNLKTLVFDALAPSVG